MIKESLYNLIQTSKEDVKHLGFDYKAKGVLLKNSLSNVLYNNEKIAGFLDSLNEQIVMIVNAPKKIKTFVNFSVKKDTDKIN